MRPARGAASTYLAVVAGILLLVSGIPDASANFPVLPTATSEGFLSALAVPTVTPGGIGTLTGTLSNPLADPITGVNLTLQFYAFNAYPGNATNPIPAGGAPTFDAPSGPGLIDWSALASIAPGASVPIRVDVVVPSDAAAGAYAIRTHLVFTDNGTTYLLASRGYFSYAQWTNATAGPNGTSTLNLTRLDVSGILPETALSVSSNPFPWVVAALVGGAVVLVAAGAYVAARPSRASRSGARRAPPVSAPRAFGNSLSSPGD